MKTNTPSPLIPQGTFLDARGKSHIRIAVFTILAVHVVLFTALLMAGCRKNSSDLAANDGNVASPTFDQASTTFPPPDTSAPPTTLTAPGTPATAPTTPVTPGTPPGMASLGPTQTLTPSIPAPSSGITPSTGPTTPSEVGDREIAIVKGDSFYTLARKYGVTMKAIQSANLGVDSTKLKIGQKIKIPAPTAPTASAPGAAAAGTAENGSKIHVVKSGETLTSIAKLEGSSIKAIKTANNLKMNNLKAGQKLKIPVKAAPAPVPTPEPFTPPVPGPGTAPPAPAPGPSGTAPTTLGNP